MHLTTGGSYRTRDIVPLWRFECIHRGVSFPRRYAAKGLTLYPVAKAKGKDGATRLSPDAEEFAVMFAKRVVSAAPPGITFVTNFATDFNILLPPDTPLHRGETFLKLWDWTRLRREDDETTPVTAAEAPQRQKYEDVVRIDGQDRPVSRPTVDRPGIFTARSDKHPMHGRIRTRIRPGDVTLNMSRGARVPGRVQEWKAILHDPYVSWLARWRDPLTGRYKYMTVATREEYRDRKFELARRLGTHLSRIVSNVHKVAGQNDDDQRWIATCVALIFAFGIRKGGAAADVHTHTGAITLSANQVDVGRPCVIRLRFTGKDAVPFDKTKNVAKSVYDAIRELKGKRRGGDDDEDRLFPSSVNSESVNAFLDSQMPGLTSKVVRTNMATSHVRERLACVKKQGMHPTKHHLEVALLEVAEKLNHRKAVKGIVDDDGNRNREKAFHAMTSDFWGAVDEKRVRDSYRTIKDLGKELRLAPATSKLNYVDPRLLSM